MRIFAGVPRGGPSNDSGIVEVCRVSVRKRNLQRQRVILPAIGRLFY